MQGEAAGQAVWRQEWVCLSYTHFERTIAKGKHPRDRKIPLGRPWLLRPPEDLDLVVDVSCEACPGHTAPDGQVPHGGASSFAEGDDWSLEQQADFFGAE